ncbi:hypothetical protein J7J90_03375 [Candidatus Micrarchaeota archaeon]|nr:hypothetical protein [Candidatus Micrarchaeota archaeon]
MNLKNANNLQTHQTTEHQGSFTEKELLDKNKIIIESIQITMKKKGNLLDRLKSILNQMLIKHNLPEKTDCFQCIFVPVFINLTKDQQRKVFTLFFKGMLKKEELETLVLFLQKKPNVLSQFLGIVTFLTNVARAQSSVQERNEYINSIKMIFKLFNSKEVKSYIHNIKDDEVLKNFVSNTLQLAVDSKTYEECLEKIKKINGL